MQDTTQENDPEFAFARPPAVISYEILWPPELRSILQWLKSAGEGGIQLVLCNEQAIVVVYEGLNCVPF